MLPQKLANVRRRYLAGSGQPRPLLTSTLEVRMGHSQLQVFILPFLWVVDPFSLLKYGAALVLAVKFSRDLQEKSFSHILPVVVVSFDAAK